MKNWIPSFIACLSASLLSLHAEQRTWTAPDGRTTTAEFVKADASTVTLKKGVKTFNLSLAKISEADRQYVKNRLAEANKRSLSSLGEYEKYAKGSWVKGEFKKLKFQIHAPDHYENDTLLPLVIFLHGAGERGTDNEKQMDDRPKKFTSKKNQAQYPCIVVAPQCPPNKFWTEEELSESVIALTKDFAKNMPVDSNRIYLSGFSMGGFGTWNILAISPKTFAAGLPISGGGTAAMAKKIKNIPIWNFHGDADKVVSINSSRTIVEQLKKIKGNIKHTELKGAGHSIARKVLSDENVMKWLFDQKKP